MTQPDDPRKPYPRGTYAKVARRLEVTVTTVRQVALGRATSRRIARELRRELRQAQRTADRRAARLEGAGAA